MSYISGPCRGDRTLKCNHYENHLSEFQKKLSRLFQIWHTITASECISNILPDIHRQAKALLLQRTRTPYSICICISYAHYMQRLISSANRPSCHLSPTTHKYIIDASSIGSLPHKRTDTDGYVHSFTDPDKVCAGYTFTQITSSVSRVSSPGLSPTFETITHTEKEELL